MRALLQRLAVIFVFSIFLTLPMSSSAVVFVKSDAAGANNGTSWANAYTDLQTALGATSSGEIWVAAGSYYPGATGDVDASFVLKNNVAVYGGFKGTETGRNQRDWKINVTKLSGDINHDDIFGSPTWYSYNDGFRGYTGNSLHVVNGSNTNGTAVLDGFTITGGNVGTSLVGDAYAGWGSGMLVLNGRPTIRNCVFTRHIASGGGLLLSNSTPSIQNTSFVENIAQYRGAGLLATQSSGALNLTDVTFASNIATAGILEASGAGLHYEGTGSVNVTRGRFENNSLNQFYAISDRATYGAGMMVLSGTFTVKDSVFTGNSANAGGGLYAFTAGTIINSLFYGNRAYGTEMTTGQTLGNYGGALGASDFYGSTISIINSVFANNTAGEGAGVAAYNSSVADIRNSILWNNTATGIDITPRAAQVTGNFNVDYSIVQGLLSDPTGGGTVTGSGEADPQFVNLAQNDFHLQSTSPAIDAGNNASVPSTTTTDLDKNARFADAAGVPDTGAGLAPVVDMGAYEFGSAPPGASTDLLITMTDSPDPLNTGSTLTYSIAVTNIGTIAAANVSLSDPLPAGVTLQSATTTLGTCTAGATVNCSLGTLNGGGAATVTIRVTPSVAGTLTNTATVATTTPESSTANNSATATTTVNTPVSRCTGGTATLTAKTLDENNLAIVSASVKINGPNGCVSAASTGTNGEAQFRRIPAGSYTVTPTKGNCPFAPQSQTVNVTTTATVSFVGDGCN
jgi:uncharacterized repeat protein (TIGR01451 family)